MTDYTSYIRNRITELRLQKDIPEYQMSIDLGQNKNYIQSISSGKSLPSMTVFLNICDYFGITPMQFFDGAEKYPQLVGMALEEIRDFDKEDLLLLLNLFQRLREDKGYHKAKDM